MSSCERFAPLAHAVPHPSAPAAPSVFPDLRRPADPEPPEPAVSPSAPVTDAAPESALAISPAELDAATHDAYATGFAAGRSAAEQEISVAASAFARALEEVTRFRAGLIERYQGELLELALGIARKVVQRELAEHPEHWLGMIRQAVRHALDRERLRIRVGSVLHRFLVERLSELRALLDEVKELELVEDRTLTEHGCVLESEYGDLDLGVDTQIGAIRAALTEPGPGSRAP
jgi:flagellar assembly protein FliH